MRRQRSFSEHHVFTFDGCVKQATFVESWAKNKLCQV